MKKSLIRGLILLSCLFFFSSLEVAAQTLRDVADIKSDIPSMLSSLDSDSQTLDRNDPNYQNDITNIKWKYMSLELINENLGTYSHDDVLKISLMYVVEQGVTESQYEAKAFEPESQLVYDYLYAFITE